MTAAHTTTAHTPRPTTSDAVEERRPQTFAIGDVVGFTFPYPWLFRDEVQNDEALLIATDVRAFLGALQHAKAAQTLADAKQAVAALYETIEFAVVTRERDGHYLWRANNFATNEMSACEHDRRDP